MNTIRDALKVAIQRRKEVEAQIREMNQAVTELCLRHVGHFYGLTNGWRTDLHNHREAYARPRHVAMYLLKRGTTLSLREIAMTFGSKHASWVTANVGKIEAQRSVGKAYDALAIEAKLKEAGIL